MARPLGTLTVWTTDDLAEAVRRYTAGEAIRAVADAMGVNRETLRGAMARRGIARRVRPSWAGAANPQFNNGGAYINRDGYQIIYDHGRKRKAHVVVMERAIGRRLRRGEVVHHINEVRHDNRIENLMIKSNSAHARDHAIQRWARTPGA